MKSAVGIANKIVEVVAVATNGTSADGAVEVGGLVLPVWAIAALAGAGALLLLVVALGCCIWHCCAKHEPDR